MDTMMKAIVIAFNIGVIFLYVTSLILMPLVDTMELFYVNLIILGTFVFASIAAMIMAIIFDL